MASCGSFNATINRVHHLSGSRLTEHVMIEGNVYIGLIRTKPLQRTWKEPEDEAGRPDCELSSALVRLSVERVI